MGYRTRRRLAAVLVVVLLGVAIGGYWLLTPHTSSESLCNCPLAANFGLTTPSEKTVGGQHWYNFTVIAADGGLKLGQLSFEVLTQSGGVVPPSASWHLLVLGGSNEIVGEYSMFGPLANTWTIGASVPASLGQVVALGTSATISGDVFVILGAFGQGQAAHGSMSLTIP